MSEDRKAIHAAVSSGCHDAWHDFAAEEGVSVSALLEVMGEDLASVTTDQLVGQARRVDAERRRRGRS